MTTLGQLQNAQGAKSALASAGTEQKNDALLAMADALEKAQERILDANREDLTAARSLISEVMLDRLALSPARIQDMARGIRAVAALPDPVGKILSETIRPNGLVICRTQVPMGVVAIIYESRPNVTSDAAALAVKSGNVCILRCGKEAHRTAFQITKALRRGLVLAGLPETAVTLIEDTSRASAMELMTAVGLVDLLIPRGGKGLISACMANAKVPCIQTGTGICHVYVDKAADQEMALDIVENAKASRPSVCNAEEVCLVHAGIADCFLPALKQRLVDERRGGHPVELRLDRRAQKIIPGVPAGEQDFDTEFLDYILAVKVVDHIDKAISHISAHSTDTVRRLSRRIPMRQSILLRVWTVLPSMSMRLRGSPTEKNSDWAVKWGFRRKSSMRGALLGWKHCALINM